jgi:predicted aspartyl protease
VLVLPFLRDARLPGLLLAALLPLAPAAVNDSRGNHDRLRENLLFTTVRVAGAGERQFVLDTGASSTAIVNRRVARKLDLQIARSITVAGAGSDDCRADVTADLPLTVAGQPLGASPIDVIDLAPIEKVVGLPIDGVVGGRLFLAHQVQLDYRHRRAAAVARTPHDDAGFTSIPMSRAAGLCCLVDARVTIGGQQMQARLLLDTGAPGVDLALGPRFVRDHGLSGSNTAETTTLPGLCAPTTLQRSDRAAVVEMGGHTQWKVKVAFSLDRTGAFAGNTFDGIIGGVFLRRFRAVVIDGPGGRLLLRPR